MIKFFTLPNWLIYKLFMTISNIIKNNPTIFMLKMPANIVGLVRVGLLCILIFSMQGYPLVSSVLYLIALFLDALDGYLARRFNQETNFGRILDMVTDRALITLLLIALSHIYQSIQTLFTTILLLDLTSHIAIIYVTAIIGSKTHKSTLANQNKLLQIYYKNRLFLGTICAMHDLFFLALFLHYFYPQTISNITITILAIGATFKIYIHILQLFYAFKTAIFQNKTHC